MRLFALAAVAFALMTGPGQAQSPQTASAIFAGGCFWCMEPPYDQTEGVITTTSGYAGGSQGDATYEQVSAGGTGHYEVVKVDYDPAKVSYEKLLEVFWPNIDPFDAEGQFCDKGLHYRAAIFYGNDQEKQQAEASLTAITDKLGKKVETQLLPAPAFYPAEDYHQDYYQKNPLKYKFYRYGCGRDARLETVWGAAATAKK